MKKTIEPVVRVFFHGLAAGGEAVGREMSGDEADGEHLGRVVFALGGAIGETARVRIESEHANFARGVIESVEKASVSRVAAPCRYFGVAESPHQTRARPQDGCGGCQWQHIEYSMQLASKRDIVVGALRRVAGLGDAETLVEKCVPSPRQFAYRNKADFVVAFANEMAQNASAKNASAQNHRIEIGFRKRESHDVVDIENCPIQSDGNNALLRLVREFCLENCANLFDENGRSIVERVVIRTSSRGEMLVAQTASAWRDAEKFARFLMNNAPNLRGVLARTQRQTRLLAGEEWLEEEVLDLKLRVWGDDFFQVNSSLAATLLQTALEMCGVKSGERVLDLYCGVGLFALALAKRGAQVVGIEGNARAIEYAKINARLNNCEAEFLAGDAAATLRRWRTSSTRSRENSRAADVVLLDPPRAGAKNCLAEIVALKPRRIVYVSCDAATLARDIKVLQSHNYRLRRAVPLDLFPQTSHVETIAQLDFVERS